MHGLKAPEGLLAFCSGGLSGPSGTKQLEQVGRQAYQFPFAANIVQATQAEAPEASLLLDLSEDRLDDCLAHFVNGSPGLGTQFVPHRLLRRCQDRRRLADCFHCLFAFVAPRCDMQIDARHAFIRRVGLAPLTGVVAGRFWSAAQILFHLA